MTTPLTFGIRYLDRLYGVGDEDAQSASPSEALPEKQFTTTIVGPDGCGKSLLAMHMCSKYWLQCREHKEENHKKTTGKKEDHAKFDQPIIIYVSTDYGFDQAEEAWHSFGLNLPRWREDQLELAYGKFQDEEALVGELVKKSRDAAAERLDLYRISPHTSSDAHGLAAVLDDSDWPREPRVFFVDLRDASAGDDWLFVNNLLGLLPSARRYPHLVVIDAVEGLETFAGERDAFGERRSRRSRVAQLTRNAAKAKSHLVFIVEQARSGNRLPEQFVADLVVNLRSSRVGDFMRRTVEIEKCRAGWHTRGEHEFAIRDGRGASSGKHTHLDDPIVAWGKLVNGNFRVEPHDLTKPRAKRDCLSHFRIITSLHSWNSTFRRRRDRLNDKQDAPYFGLPPLDELLALHLNRPADGATTPVADSAVKIRPGRNVAKTEQAPVHCYGSLTFLLGDAGTYKSRLARQFLSCVVSDQTSPQYGLPGVAVSISTGLVDRDLLEDQLAHHVAHRGLDLARLKNDCAIICRRLSVRYMSSAHFLTIVERHIRAAKVQLERLLNNWHAPAHQSVHASAAKLDQWKAFYERLEESVREALTAKEEGHGNLREFAGLIRFVIDDWNVIQETHPSLSSDPLLMQSLLALLKREGVAALIVSTQPGQPLLETAALKPNDLRKVEGRHIYTWNVSFFGQRSTAVTVMERSGQAPLSPVYELRSAEMKSKYQVLTNFLGSSAHRIDEAGEAITVDRDFALYAGVERDEAHRVPLTIRLYGGRHVDGPQSEPELLFPKVLRQTLQQVFQGTAGGDVVVFEPFHTYEDFFSFADWIHNVRLDYTLVLQIDEYWNAEEHALTNLQDYWEGNAIGERTYNSRTKAWDTWKEERVEDRYGVWQPHVRPSFTVTKGKKLNDDSQLDMDIKSSAASPVPKITQQYQTRTANNHKKQADRGNRKKEADSGEAEIVADKLFRKHLCTPENRPFKTSDRIPFVWDFGLIVARRDLWETCKNERLGEGEPTVGQIWNALAPSERHHFTIDEEEYEGGKDGWPNVTWQEFFEACKLVASRHKGVQVFDSDLATPESLSCLCLELWASFEEAMLPMGQKSSFERLKDRKAPVDDNEPTLRELLLQSPLTLFAALGCIVKYWNNYKVVNRRVFHRTPDAPFVASRQWYSTACALARSDPRADYAMLRIPGRFSVRGDWFLAVASGSRSRLLGHRALDLLSSRRMNLLRLQDGLGLPVRDVAPDEIIGDILTGFQQHDQNTSRKDPLTYQELCALGAGAVDPRPLNWLWRSKILHYDRDSFYWRRWIARMLSQEESWIPFFDSNPWEEIKPIRPLFSDPAESFYGLSPKRTKELTDIQAVALNNFLRHRRILISVLRG